MSLPSRMRWIEYGFEVVGATHSRAGGNGIFKRLRTCLTGLAIAGAIFVATPPPASASLLGQTVGWCGNASFDGLATTDTSNCSESVIFETVDGSVEFSSLFGTLGINVDLTADTVSVTYNGVTPKTSNDLHILTDLSWGSMAGTIISLEEVGTNDLEITPIIVGNSLGFFVPKDLNKSGTSTFRILTTHTVPEPSALALFGLGLAGLLVMRRRRRAHGCGGR